LETGTPKKKRLGVIQYSKRQPKRLLGNPFGCMTNLRWRTSIHINWDYIRVLSYFQEFCIRRETTKLESIKALTVTRPLGVRESGRRQLREGSTKMERLGEYSTETSRRLKKA
jgi:hypothetical protein